MEAHGRNTPRRRVAPERGVRDAPQLPGRLVGLALERRVRWVPGAIHGPGGAEVRVVPGVEAPAARMMIQLDRMWAIEMTGQKDEWQDEYATLLHGCRESEQFDNTGFKVTYVLQNGLVPKCSKCGAMMGLEAWTRCCFWASRRGFPLVPWTEIQLELLAAHRGSRR